ncbi:MAG: YdcF family protein [bacterium]|nr:YdcF family protein [bacterium]
MILFICSNGFLVNEALKTYESKDTLQPDSVYNVGIVLGGFSTRHLNTGQTVFFESSDRFLQALKLYNQGKIKRILISSGSASVMNQSVKEADAVRDYLLSIHVPDSVIIVENRSRNTSENAKYSLAILDSMEIKSGILIISSAWHLPRAKLCFNKRDSIAYFATNYYSKPIRDYSPDNLLVPSAEALAKSEYLIKEWFGYLVYWLKE